MDRTQTLSFFDALLEIFTREEQPLNALDAQIGDGDHGTTILRGMLAAHTSAHASASLRPGPMLLEAATAFQKATGGAGGTLFAQLFKGLGAAAGEAKALDREIIARGLADACRLVQKLGRARRGDKTMFDALEPASLILTEGKPVADAAAAARSGVEATRDMSAALGRARFVADGGRGHFDPGAWSIALILEELSRQFTP